MNQSIKENNTFIHAKLSKGGENAQRRIMNDKLCKKERDNDKRAFFSSVTKVLTEQEMIMCFLMYTTNNSCRCIITSTVVSL